MFTMMMMMMMMLVEVMMILMTTTTDYDSDYTVVCLIHVKNVQKYFS